MQTCRKIFTPNETQLNTKPLRQSTDSSNTNSSLTNPTRKSTSASTIREIEMTSQRWWWWWGKEEGGARRDFKGLFAQRGKPDGIRILILIAFVDLRECQQPHRTSYSNYFYGSVFFSLDPLCIRCLWVSEVGSGAGLVWHAWFGEEKSGFVVLSGMGRAGHHPHTRYAPRHPLSQSSCEHSLVSRFLSVAPLVSCLSCMSCLLCDLFCFCLASFLSLSCLVCVFFSVCPSLCPSLCLSVSVWTSVRACLCPCVLVRSYHMCASFRRMGGLLCVWVVTVKVIVIILCLIRLFFV